MNNVNVGELQKFVDLLTKNPKEALREKSVVGNWVLKEGEPQFVAELSYQKGKAVVSCELPPFAGGWGTSPDPIQYCLFGLSACFAVTFAATATKEGVTLKSLRVTAENKMDLRKQMGLSKENIIQSVKFRVHAEADVPRSTLEKILKLAEERCPGTECVTRSIPLSIELE